MNLCKNWNSKPMLNDAVKINGADNAVQLGSPSASHFRLSRLFAVHPSIADIICHLQSVLVTFRASAESRF